MNEYRLVGNETAPTVRLIQTIGDKVSLSCSDGRKMNMLKTVFEKNFELIEKEA